MFAIKNGDGLFFVESQTWSKSIANAKRFKTILEAAWALADAEFESFPVSIVCADCGESPCIPLLASVTS